MDTKLEDGELSQAALPPFLTNRTVSVDVKVHSESESAQRLRAV